MRVTPVAAGSISGVAVQEDKRFPVRASQIRAVPSPPPVRTRLPSGLKTAQSTSPMWPLRTARLLPLRASQVRAVPSLLAVTTRVPSGLKTALSTASVWPLRTARRLPVRASQTVAQSSSSAVTTRLPSGLKAALLVPSPEPFMTARLLPFRASETSVLPPVRPLKPLMRTRVPSGLNEAPSTRSSPRVCMTVRNFPLCASQICALPSSLGPPSLAITIRVPSGLKVALSTEPSLPRRRSE